MLIILFTKSLIDLAFYSKSHRLEAVVFQLKSYYGPPLLNLEFFKDSRSALT